MKRSIEFRFVPLLVAAVVAFGAGSASAAPAADIDPALAISGPYVPPPRFFASTDAKHDNEDYLKLKPGETRRIPLTAGRLLRLWSTAFEPDKIGMTLEGYSSGPPAPPVALLHAGKASEGSYENKTYLWYPAIDEQPRRMLGKSATLVVKNLSKETNKWFYQATVQTGAVTVPSIFGAKSIEHGQPRLLVETEGPSVVNGLDIKFKSKPDSAALQKIRILVTLQPKEAGTATELIDVPLGPLVGSFKGDAGPLQDAMTQWDGQNLTLRWPMPFDGARQKLQVEITGAEAAIEAGVAALPTDIPFRFHAAFGSQRTTRKQPIPVLKITGQGAFSGLRMSASAAPDSGRRAFAYLEGNEMLIADGKTYEGTGTEDFFNSAWYFPEKTFARPYGGLTERTALPPSVSMYRLMVPDALPFKRDFKFDFEVGRKNNADDLEYRWVAFWYQKESGTVAIEDALHGAGGDTSTNPLSGTRVDNTPNGVKSLPDMPVAVEIVVGVVLLAGVILALTAIFRRKKN